MALDSEFQFLQLLTLLRCVPVLVAISMPSTLTSKYWAQNLVLETSTECKRVNLVDGIETGIEPESKRSVSLAIGGCAMLNCARQTAINAQAWMQPDPARERVSVERKTRVRPRYLIGYLRTTDKVAWSGGKSMNMESETPTSWAGPTNQDERSGFDKKTPWTKSRGMHRAKWRNQKWWPVQSMI